MAEAKFTKEGRIENLADLTPAEIEDAHLKQREAVFGRAKTAEEKAEAERIAREKLEADLKAEREKNTQPDNKGLDEQIKPLQETVATLQLSERKRQFGYEHNLSPAEVDQIFKINPNPTKETLDDPFIKGGLETLRNRDKQARNTPSGSPSGGLQTGGKKLSDMSPEEKQKAFEESQEARKRRTR